VAARVNNEIITENELLLAAFGNIGQAETLLPGTAPDVRAVLRAMIDERLIAQAAREQVREIPDEIITNRVEAEIKAQRQMFRTDAAFEAWLEQRGWDLASYKKHIRRQEERYYLVHMAVSKRVQMTEDDVAAYAAQLQRKGESLVRYRLRQILVALPRDAAVTDVKRAEQRVVRLLEEARRGVPFIELAREYSDDAAARKTGGDLGWMGARDLQRPILKAIESLEPRALSPVVRTDKGFHIFWLVAKRTPKELLFEKRVEEERRKWAAALRRSAQVKILIPRLAE
jgi:peptidyl-prolyl cis-trans isomerase SurA